MAGLDGTPLGYFFGNNPNVNQELRRRIALQMLAQKRAAPKTFGEGLSAIGDALGDRGIIKALEDQDVAAQASGNAKADALLAPPAAAKPYAPTEDVETPPAVSAVNNAARSLPPIQPPPIQPPPIQPQVQPPPPLTTAPSQPSSMLHQQPQSGLGPSQPQPPQLSGQPMLPPPETEAGVVGNDVNVPMDPMAPRSRAIAGIESGGAKNPYTLMGAPTRTGDRAIGKYQIMGANVPEWTQAALGRAMTPEEFRNDSAAQEKVFAHRFGGYADKYGEEGAARAWYGGERGMKNLDATDVHGRLTVGTYGQDYMRRLNGGQPGNARDAIASALVTQQPQAQAFAGPEPQAPPQQPPVQMAQATGISAAPPQPSPVRQAPEQQPFRMERPVMPVAPEPTRMGDQERRLREAVIRDPNNEQLARRLLPVIQEMEKVRGANDQRNIEEWKAKVQHHNTLDSKYLDWRAGEEERDQKRQKAPLEIRKMDAETKKIETEVAAGKVPTTRKLNDADVQWDEVRKEWIKPPGSAVGTGNPETTEAQSKDISSYERGRRALHNIGDGKALHNWVDWYGSGLPVIGNLITNPQFQTQYNAAREFASIALRKETGAGTNASEIADVINRYIPKPGASAEVQTQMKRSREAIFEGLRDGIGGKHLPTLDRFDARLTEEMNAAKAAKDKLTAEGKPSSDHDVAAALPPAVVTSKAEKDALPVGRRYRLPSDEPDTIRVKKSHD